MKPLTLTVSLSDGRVFVFNDTNTYTYTVKFRRAFIEVLWREVEKNPSSWAITFPLTRLAAAFPNYLVALVEAVESVEVSS